jgi:RNA polymerase sigma-70 factor (ECF subfamily)
MGQVGPTGGDIGPEILDACRRGDRDAFRALYEAYKDRVYSTALYFFHGDADAAADVTQQVFVQLIRGIGAFRGDAAFATWLHRLVMNACIDRSRRRRADSATTTDPATLNAVPATATAQDAALTRRELTSAIARAIGGLPAKLRAVMLLRYFQDMSYDDIASAQRCSIGTVASRLSRAHRLLAAKLAPLRAPLPSAEEREA